MRFATLVVLTVVASTTPGLAAPAPYTYVPLSRKPLGRSTEYPSSPHQANPKRDTTTTAVQNGTLSANVGSDITKLVKCVYLQLYISKQY
jgi:hypothetical protein